MRSTDGFAAEVLRRAGLRDGPPIDVALLARRLGVDRIVRRDMFEEGRLERRAHEVNIFVRRDLSGPRARFTVAHEIAHLLLAEPGGHLVAHRDRLRVDDEERLCDQIAAAILLPAPWVRRGFAHRPHNLSTVRHLSHAAQVSLAVAAVRLTEICGWTSSLLRWRRSDGRWRYLAGAAIPPSLHGAVASAPTTSALLDQLERRTRRDVRVDLPVTVDGKVTAVPAQLSVNRTAALALAELVDVPGDARTS